MTMLRCRSAHALHFDSVRECTHAWRARSCQSRQRAAACLRHAHQPRHALLAHADAAGASCGCCRGRGWAVGAASARVVRRCASTGPAHNDGASPSLSSEAPIATSAVYWEIDGGVPELHHSLLRLRLVDEAKVGLGLGCGFGALARKYCAAKPLVHGCHVLYIPYGVDDTLTRKTVGEEEAECIPNWGVIEFLSTPCGDPSPSSSSMNPAVVGCRGSNSMPSEQEKAAAEGEDEKYPPLGDWLEKLDASQHETSLRETGYESVEDLVNNDATKEDLEYIIPHAPFARYRILAALQSLRRRERPGDEQLETPRERQLALIAADWRERNAGAEPSVTTLREIRSMLDDLSRIHSAQNAGAPPNDDDVLGWFGISDGAPSRPKREQPKSPQFKSSSHVLPRTRFGDPTWTSVSNGAEETICTIQDLDEQLVLCLGHLHSQDVEMRVEAALADSRRSLGHGHPRTLASMQNLGKEQGAKGDLDSAAALYEEVVKGQRRVFGDKHPHTIASIGNLGLLRQAKGNLDGAEALYEEVRLAKGRPPLRSISRRVVYSDYVMGDDGKEGSDNADRRPVHWAEFNIVKANGSIKVGVVAVATAGLRPWQFEHFWGSDGHHHSARHVAKHGAPTIWEGHCRELPKKERRRRNETRWETIDSGDAEWRAYQPTYCAGDTVGLALDVEGGTLTAFKNGVWLGILAPNAQSPSIGAGPFCWAVELEGTGSVVEIADGLPLTMRELRRQSNGGGVRRVWSTDSPLQSPMSRPAIHLAMKHDNADLRRMRPQRWHAPPQMIDDCNLIRGKSGLLTTGDPVTHIAKSARLERLRKNILWSWADGHITEPDIKLELLSGTTSSSGVSPPRNHADSTCISTSNSKQLDATQHSAEAAMLSIQHDCGGANSAFASHPHSRKGYSLGSLQIVVKGQLTRVYVSDKAREAAAAFSAASSTSSMVVGTSCLALMVWGPFLLAMLFH